MQMDMSNFNLNTPDSCVVNDVPSDTLQYYPDSMICHENIASTDAGMVIRPESDTKGGSPNLKKLSPVEQNSPNCK